MELITDPKIIEPRIRALWEEQQTYTWDPQTPREDIFTIDTPPPTVSGNLHIGHFFSYTQTDFIARFQRMRGKSVFYPLGFDDNGLPTERLVEKIKGIKATNMDRNQFIDLCRDIIPPEEEKFRQLFKTMGLSIDWSQEYRTISPYATKISQMSFLDLLNKGKVYRKLAPTIWDSQDQTALAQSDLIDTELPGVMYQIKFYGEKGDILPIATTRPELIPAAVALFYHPDDIRYNNLVNQWAYTPREKIKIPILADSQVDMNKGTGLVMCSTFGDTTDVHWWKTHNLPLKIILDKAGKINNSGPREFLGLTVPEARKLMVKLLSDDQLIISQTNIQHQVKCGERSGSPVEILVTNQWMIKILEEKDNLMVRARECKWHPSHMKDKIDQWIGDLNCDWCISRQRFFGIPFPVWYSERLGEEGKLILPSLDQLPLDPLIHTPAGYTREEIQPETDIMDTWATSSLTPQLNSGWDTDPIRHQKLFPADLRPQAHEIIRTWAFYTIAKSHLHHDTIPWKNLMISGWCLAEDKTKISKSKQNASCDPATLMAEHGVDAMRYWATSAKLGNDIIFSLEIIRGGKKLINKLFNAAKFAALYFPHHNINGNVITNIMDLWIISELTTTIENVTREFSNFEYYEARKCLETFFWSDFCNQYLEIIKYRLYDKDHPEYGSAITTLYYVLKTILKLFAPFLPYTTEEIYQKLYRKKFSIHSRGNWPDTLDWGINPTAEFLGKKTIQIIDWTRKFRSENKLSRKQSISMLKIYPGSQLVPMEETLIKGTNSDKIIFLEELEDGMYTSEDSTLKITIIL